ncbi:MAG: hypothetical protein M0Q93_12465, partial [Terrimicrobiaceae bacterium]|nr:hypothetical protein [Terrimicrobiaceae bacterium]
HTSSSFTTATQPKPSTLSFKPDPSYNTSSQTPWVFPARFTLTISKNGRSCSFAQNSFAVGPGGTRFQWVAEREQGNPAEKERSYNASSSWSV